MTTTVSLPNTSCVESFVNEIQAPFPESDIEWRVCRSGVTKDRPWIMCLCYVTNRAIMDRLDKTVGPQNWKNEFTQAPEGGVLCGISIRFDEIGWVTKWDGADNTDIEAVKGGLSSSMKRAAVQWGIGRYLYRLEENFAEIGWDGKFKAKIKDQYYKWNPPPLPKWAVPSKDDSKSEKPVKPSTIAKIPPKKSETKEDVKTTLGSELPSMVDKLVDEQVFENVENVEKPEASNKVIQKAKMIDKIMKMNENMNLEEWESFKKERIGDRGLVDLNNDELAKLGTELRDIIREKEYEEAHK